MTVTAHWDDEEKTIVRVDFSGRWTMKEFFATCEETIRPMLDEADHTIHFFGEITSMYVPTGILTSFHQMTDIPQMNHDNAGMIVMWGGPRVIDTFGNMFISVFGKSRKMVMVRSEEEARAAIEKYNNGQEKPLSNTGSSS